MKRFWILVLTLVSAAAAENVDSLSRLRVLFTKPPAEFSTVPFLAWNGDMTEAMIDRELKDFSEQGVHAFIIHPRAGLINPGEGRQNVIEVLVTGSLKNLLGPHHGNIARGSFSPSNSRRGPAAMPPRASYDLYPYGLMENSQVVRVE